MKTTAIFANFGLLAVVTYELVAHGLPPANEALPAALAILAPMLSLIALAMSKSKNLLSLYLQRRALEEQRRINDLSNASTH